MAKLGDTAIVAGRSMAGIAAAAALRNRFERVLILDKDPETSGPQPRTGVGQGNHLHNLLKGGERAVEKLLPGARAKLMAMGAVAAQQGVDVLVYDHGQELPKRDLGYDNIVATRPLIEHAVFQRLLEEAGVEVRHETTAEGLVFDGHRVTGIAVQGMGGGQDRLSADLVVDCTGRMSKAPKMLSAQGLGTVQEFKVNMGISYTSALFESPGAAPGWGKGVTVLPAPPVKRGAFIGASEDGKWLVSLHTRFERQLPTTHEEMIVFASEIPETREFADFLMTAKALTPVRSYRKPDAIWRRFDKLAAFPEGFLVLGDSIASFNPVFGQGMSAAWLQAAALDDILGARASSGGGLDGLAKDYLPQAMAISREAWNASTLVDAAYDEVSGDRRPGSKQGIAYLRALRTLLAADAELHADYIGVSQMITPASELMRPDRVTRVMAAMTGTAASAGLSEGRSR